MFIDEATIHLKAGNGGSGCVAFRREKFVPKGGPSGGDGGAGGSIYALATARLNTLYHLKFRREWKGGRGEHGQGSNRTGSDGEEVVIELPIGSIIRDAASGELIADLLEEGQRVLLARGGRGGQGNQHFATATRQAPRFAQPGEEGEERTVRIELKLIADVGIVGLPNAGKSTLISVISAARPKIADYPFTTLVPNLGVVSIDDETMVVADIPGLIEGAHEGHGLGDRFLRHVERCATLVHLVDLSASDHPSDEAVVVAKELALYSATLAAKPRVICGSKLDAAHEGASDDLRRHAQAEGLPYFEISAIAGTGVTELLRQLMPVVLEHRQNRPEVATAIYD
jgi:GTPase